MKRVIVFVVFVLSYLFHDINAMNVSVAKQIVHRRDERICELRLKAKKWERVNDTYVVNLEKARRQPDEMSEKFLVAFPSMTFERANTVLRMLPQNVCALIEQKADKKRRGNGYKFFKYSLFLASTLPELRNLVLGFLFEDDDLQEVGKAIAKMQSMPIGEALMWCAEISQQKQNFKVKIDHDYKKLPLSFTQLFNFSKEHVCILNDWEKSRDWYPTKKQLMLCNDFSGDVKKYCDEKMCYVSKQKILTLGKRGWCVFCGFTTLFLGLFPFYMSCLSSELLYSFVQEVQNLPLQEANRVLDIVEKTNMIEHVGPLLKHVMPQPGPSMLGCFIGVGSYSLISLFLMVPCLLYNQMLFDGSLGLYTRERDRFRLWIPITTVFPLVSFLIGLGSLLTFDGPVSDETCGKCFDIIVGCGLLGGVMAGMGQQKWNDWYKAEEKWKELDINTYRIKGRSEI